MFTDSLFDSTRDFTDIAQPTWTFNNVNNMGGGTRNNIIYLEPFSCVAEIFTLHIGDVNLHELIFCFFVVDIPMV